MMKKTLVAAAVTAAALGTGGVVVATAGGAAANVAPSTSTALSDGSAANLDAAAASPAGVKGKGAKARARAKNRPRLGRALHGSWVTQKGAPNHKTTVTHDAIRGAASAVSATSITITAADKFGQTYHLTGTTKVRVFDATTHKATAGTISSVHNGDRVRVRGIGTTTLVATTVVVVHKK